MLTKEKMIAYISDLAVDNNKIVVPTTDATYQSVKELFYSVMNQRLKDA